MQAALAWGNYNITFAPALGSAVTVSLLSPLPFDTLKINSSVFIYGALAGCGRAVLKPSDASRHDERVPATITLGLELSTASTFMASPSDRLARPSPYGSTTASSAARATRPGPAFSSWAIF